jgi:hypothetical protein
MKTVRVTRVFDPEKLHRELLNVGIPIVTVRASHPDAGGPAVYGVVVLEDKADLKKVQALIQGHKDSRKPSRQPDPTQMEAALKEMEKV